MVAFVILNWNNPEHTIKAIESIEKFEINLPNKSIIVIDNGSEQSKRNLLLEYFFKQNGMILSEENIENHRTLETEIRQKILILNKNNYGYAKGNNIGLKFAKKLGFKYAVIMNNDVELKEPVVVRLLDVIKSSDRVALVGPSVVGPNGNFQSPIRKPGIYSEFVVPLFFPFSYIYEKIKNKKFYKHLIIKASEKGYVYVYRIMGCFMLVDLEVMEKVGWFDENTFLYAEEPILAEKLQRLGYKIAFVPQVTVFHHHELSTKTYFGKDRWLIQLKSDLYYFKNYRNFNNFQLFLVKIGTLYRIYVWRNIKLFLKK